MELTVREVLKLKGMSGCTLLAGTGGLDRVIKHVSWIEVPDVINWLKGNELLFSNLYAFQNDSASILKLVKELNLLGSAALAVKTGRFIAELPPEVLSWADASNFPIIEVPSHLKYVDLTNTVVMEMFEKESYDLRLSEKLHKRFITELLKQGGGFNRIALLLSQLIYNPVSILDLEGNLMSTIGFGNGELEGVQFLIPPVSENVASEWRHDYQQVGDIQLRNILVPVRVGRDCYGYLLVWERYRPLKDSDRKVIESVLPILALEFFKHKEIEILRQQHRQDFIDNLVLGEFTDEQTAQHHLQRSGWELAGDIFGVMVVNLDFGSPEDKGYKLRPDLGSLEHGICRKVRDLAGKYCDTALVGRKGDRLIVITNFKELTERNYRYQLDRFGRAVRTALKEISPDLATSIGVGKCCIGLCGCLDSYREARKAAICARVSWQGGIAFFDDLNMYEVILNSNTQDKLVQSAERVLYPLVKYDQHNDIQLLHTLEVYLSKDCDIKKTAAELFLHHNTVKYRLRRIEQLSGRSLSSEEDRFHLHLALKIRTLCKR